MLSGQGRSTAKAGRRSSVWGLRFLTLGLVVGLWFLLVELEVWSPLILPRPSSVWDAFVQSVTTDGKRRGLAGYFLWEHLQASLWRVLNGVFWAIILGIAVGFVLALVVADPHHARAVGQLPAQPAAARLLHDPDLLVRHRGHLEDLAAVPRRVPADHARHDERHRTRPHRSRRCRSIARRFPPAVDPSRRAAERAARHLHRDSRRRRGSP